MNETIQEKLLDLQGRMESDNFKLRPSDQKTLLEAAKTIDVLFDDIVELETTIKIDRIKHRKFREKLI